MHVYPFSGPHVPSGETMAPAGGVYAVGPADAAVDGGGYEPGVMIMVVSTNTVLFDLDPVELAVAVGKLTAGDGDVIGLITSDEGGGRMEDEARVLCGDVAVATVGVDLTALADKDGLRTELKELGVEMGALGITEEVRALGVADEAFDGEIDPGELLIVGLEIDEGA